MIVRAALTLALALGLVASLAAQATTGQGPARNKFLSGWMAELLHVDRDAAVKSYREAMLAKDLPNFQSELATLRLWESTWKSTARAQVAEAARKRGLITFDPVSTRSGSFFLRSIDADKFSKALETGDVDALDRLRDQLADSVKRNTWMRDPRPLVEIELHNFRGETDQVDSELESLKQKYKEAKDSDDNKKAREIRFQIYNRVQTKRRTASRRVNGKRWSEMTRLHLEGHHDRASGMEARLPRTRGQRVDAATLLRQIQGWSKTYQAARAKTLLANLDAQFLRRELLAEERAVLKKLRERLEQLITAGLPDQALVLAARTPYRDRLLAAR